MTSPWKEFPQAWSPVHPSSPTKQTSLTHINKLPNKPSPCLHSLQTHTYAYLENKPWCVDNCKVRTMSVLSFEYNWLRRNRCLGFLQKCFCSWLYNISNGWCRNHRTSIFFWILLLYMFPTLNLQKVNILTHTHALTSNHLNQSWKHKLKNIFRN